MFEKEERSGWGHPDITQITSMKKSPATAIWYLKPCCSLFHQEPITAPDFIDCSQSSILDVV